MAKKFPNSAKLGIKIKDVKSNWVVINVIDGGFQQGTLSGPEDFLNMVDDFHTYLDDIKFVDDTTIFEVVPIGQSCQLQQAADEATVWASRNNMQLNASKTKELFIYFGKQDLSVPPVITEGQKIEKVRVTKLLGLTLNDRLTWEDHINSISKKANVRLHYLHHLKRAEYHALNLLLCTKP